MGGYVLANGAGPSLQIDCRFLNVVNPVLYELRPEIGDERYPIRFALRPGSRKPLLLTVLSADHSFPKIHFEGENLPQGVKIAAVEAIPDKQQYLLVMEASANAERVWQPLVMISGRLEQADKGLVTTPYFGMAVQ
jgi:hypothetical protein